MIKKGRIFYSDTLAEKAEQRKSNYDRYNEICEIVESDIQYDEATMIGYDNYSKCGNAKRLWLTLLTTLPFYNRFIQYLNL